MSGIKFLVWFSPSFIVVVKHLLRPSSATWWRMPNSLLFGVEVLLGRAWSFSDQPGALVGLMRSSTGRIAADWLKSMSPAS